MSISTRFRTTLFPRITCKISQSNGKRTVIEDSVLVLCNLRERAFSTDSLCDVFLEWPNHVKLRTVFVPIDPKIAIPGCNILNFLSLTYVH